MSGSITLDASDPCRIRRIEQNSLQNAMADAFLGGTPSRSTPKPTWSWTLNIGFGYGNRSGSPALPANSPLQKKEPERYRLGLGLKDSRYSLIALLVTAMQLG
jgi:hypothetical protein